MSARRDYRPAPTAVESWLVGSHEQPSPFALTTFSSRFLQLSQLRKVPYTRSLFFRAFKGESRCWYNLVPGLCCARFKSDLENFQEYLCLFDRDFLGLGIGFYRIRKNRGERYKESNRKVNIKAMEDRW